MWNTDAVRWLAICDVSFLIATGGYLFITVRRALPAVLRAVTPAFALVYVAVVAGVVANMASPIPPTPGVKVLAAFATPAAMWVLLVLVRDRRSRR